MEEPPRKRSRSALLRERQSLYPSLYTSQTLEQIQQGLDQYIVEYEGIIRADNVPEISAALVPDPPSPALSPLILSSSTITDAASLPRVETSTVSSSSSSMDIWGRHPPKEYSDHKNNNSMICPICWQKVGSSLRYASHLDKCLGIGTLSRGANAALLHKS